MKAGLEKDKAALLVVIGAMADGTKEVLAVAPGFRESAESWAAVLRGLKARGLGVPKRWWPTATWASGRRPGRCGRRPGSSGAGTTRWPTCDRLPKREQTEAKLREVVYAESRAGAEKARDAFADRYADTYPKAVKILAGDWDRMTAFFDFPAGHWRHLRTTNVVESPFAAVRLRTSAAKRFRKVDGATALIWKLLMVAEMRFRKLNSPHLLPGVLAGRRYADGKPVPAEERRAA